MAGMINWLPFHEAIDYAGKFDINREPGAEWTPRKKFLVFINDEPTTTKGVSTAELVIMANGTVKTIMASYNGDWNITHFALINEPE